MLRIPYIICQDKALIDDILICESLFLTYGSHMCGERKKYVFVWIL